jgi:hypothetical protein
MLPPLTICIRYSFILSIALLLVFPALAHAQEDGCAQPANPIVAENCQAGTTEWQIENDLRDIEGYASATSANKGETLDFFVNTSAAQFDILIFRSGYYDGSGGRLVETIPNVQGQQQPECYREFDTGLYSCSNWAVSTSLSIPQDWVSGVYIAKLLRPDTGGEGYILFVVRDDEHDSAILYQQSTTTYQAYNNYGGKSAYDYNSYVPVDCETVAGTVRAVATSFNRPYANISEPNFYFYVEYPMVYWLESQGYDTAYSTNLDTHQSGSDGAHNELLDHAVFLSVGHDEYWTQEMYDAIMAARDGGVHIGFFSANTAFWRVRLEDDNGQADRTMITYKSTQGGPPDPSGHATGTFRDPNGANNPENDLLGIMYIGDNNIRSFPLRINAENAQHPIYRNTGLQEMPPGTYANIGQRLIGWEWDAAVDNGLTPDNLEILAASPINGVLLTDAGNYLNNDLRFVEVQTTRYVAPGGAIVFATGTIQWAWGLALEEPNPIIQQITYNVLADMGVQPATPDDTLILDGEAGTAVLPEITILPQDEDTTPIISNLSAVPISETEVVITWETDTETNGQLFLGFSPAAINQQIAYDTDDSYTLEHELTASFLQAATTYYFRVVSSDSDEHTIISDVGSFQTPSGGIGVQVRGLLRPVYHPLDCWALANPVPAHLGVVVAALVLVIGGWRISRRLFRKA